MRKTLPFVVAVSLISAFNLSPVNGASLRPVSVYAPSLSTGSLSDPPTLLQMAGDEHRLASASDLETRPPVGPENSVVEAIPTPTAFHAGVVLLLLIFLARFIRKPRWV